MADGDDLDALVRRVDPDRWLSSRFISDPEKRADVIALYAFDHELARAPKVASNPLIAEIRLTWWREALDEIYSGGVVRAHPAARALGVAVGRRALPRGPLETMIDARLETLEGEGLQAETEAAGIVGGATAHLAARMLDPTAPPEPIRNWGQAWGLAMLRRSSRTPNAGLDEAIELSVRRAKGSSRRIGAAAFPAIAHASLITESADHRPWSPIRARGRLLWAVLRGQI